LIRHPASPRRRAERTLSSYGKESPTRRTSRDWMPDRVRHDGGWWSAARRVFGGAPHDGELGGCRDNGKDQIPGWWQVRHYDRRGDPVDDDPNESAVGIGEATHLSIEHWSTPILRHPGPRAGVQPANVCEPKGLSHALRVSLLRDGHRVTGSRLKAGMTESWESAARRVFGRASHDGELGGCRDNGKDQIPGWWQVRHYDRRGAPVDDEPNESAVGIGEATHLSMERRSTLILRHPGLEPGSSRRTPVSRKNLLTQSKASPTRWTSRDWMPDRVRHDGRWWSAA
jgi:hypothetical protein